jgi:ribose transport system substrate-binding protein
MKRGPSRRWLAHGMLACAAGCLACACSSGVSNATPSSSDSLGVSAAYYARAEAVVKAADTSTTTWTGPTTGPKAAKKEFIVDVSEAQSNSGPEEVGVGAAQAAKALGWKFEVIDGQGTITGNEEAMNEALALNPTGIFLNADTPSEVSSDLKIAAKRHIPVVGWHVNTVPGPMGGSTPVYYNVESNQTAAATAMADYAIVQTKGHVNAAIITWSTMPVAVLKTEVMRNVLETCKGCSVLSYANYPLTTATTTLPTYITGLLDQYGSGAHKLNYMMFMNDQYADDTVPSLRTAGIPTSGSDTVSLVSVGDGTVPAFQRIRAGNEYQVATLPEPVYEDGWEVMDEFNRAFHNLPPDNYVTPVHLVTSADVNEDGGTQNVYNPPNNYQEHYEEIWGVK